MEKELLLEDLRNLARKVTTWSKERLDLDNHGKYLVGSRRTANEFRIRRLDELYVK